MGTDGLFRVHPVGQAHEQVIAEFPVLADDPLVITLTVQGVQVAHAVIVGHQPPHGQPGVTAPAEKVHHTVEFIVQLNEFINGLGHAVPQFLLAAHPRQQLLDLVQERLDFAKSLGIEHVINSGKEDAVQRVAEITGGMMAQQVMECSGANAAVRSTLDLVSNAGRITLTGWPKKETSLPTDVITKKEVDIRGARTSAGEFEEALDLIFTKKVDMMKILTKTVSMDEAPDTIIDIEKNPGSYMKVVVRVGEE